MAGPTVGAAVRGPGPAAAAALAGEPGGYAAERVAVRRPCRRAGVAHALRYEGPLVAGSADPRSAKRLTSIPGTSFAGPAEVVPV